MSMNFYDFEVFKRDWLVVIQNPIEHSETVIVNNKAMLEDYYNRHKDEIWIGFNTKHYDQYILKGILLNFDPYDISKFIIRGGHDGWEYSRAFNSIQLYNYDIMSNIDRGLKFFEGSLGNSIEESSVPFDINRKLTDAEIGETVKYCRHDVEQAMEVFLIRKDDFDAQTGLLKMFDLPLSYISKTKVQLSAAILEAEKRRCTDEFEISFPETLKLEKYAFVKKWYEDKENRDYTKSLDVEVAGVPHSFGWGGVHGAKEKYISDGYFINMDVSSLYPSLMIRYDLISRACNGTKFKDIVDLRLKYKAEKNPLQAPLKIVINGTYGAMKDCNNPLYDPLMANNVCVYGQLLLLDLIEHLEPYCEIVQSNTDGVLIRKPDSAKDIDKFYELIDDIAYEWEQRTGLNLEFDEYTKVIQKDVNNYIVVADDGHWKSKGAYVKKLGKLDYDLPIVNKAVTDYFLKGVDPTTTIMNCNDLKEFQQVKKIGAKYSTLLHGDNPLNEKCVRCFASRNERDGGLSKIHVNTGKTAKLEGTPEHCFLVNGDVNEAKVDGRLDKKWYIGVANKRIESFVGGTK